MNQQNTSPTSIRIGSLVPSYPEEYLKVDSGIEAAAWELGIINPDSPQLILPFITSPWHWEPRTLIGITDTSAEDLSMDHSQ